MVDHCFHKISPSRGGHSPPETALYRPCCSINNRDIVLFSRKMDRAGVLPTQLSYDFLKEITDGFSEARLLGSGGYGKVYMGVHKDGKKIAVKILPDTLPGFDDDQFKKEFNNLTSLQHHNIVRLLGYCHETQQESVQHNGREIRADRIYRALCFEYMHNGSLEGKLSDENSGEDWHTRFGIIKGVWNGLKYLHKEMESPMYHLDLKPANILLDKNMVPKIADFGLSRFFGEELTRTTRSTGGTIGYLPPEYIDTHKISNKFDIFSLGVVTIKIIAGPKGYYKIDQMPNQQFIKLVQGNWRNMLEKMSLNEAELYSEQVKTCIEIALMCVKHDRCERPSIDDIVEKIKETETMIRLGLSTQERLSDVENLFGEVVDNYKLDKMARYMGKPKTQEDRAREAGNLVHEHDKDGKASRYVYDHVPFSSSSFRKHGTYCLVYNATGNTLYYVTDHDWDGHIGSVPYPKEIGNGQWAAFHHALYFEWTTCSMAAVVYRGKNKHGKDKDYLLAWSRPNGWFDRNKIGGANYFQTRWVELKNQLVISDYSCNFKWDGDEIDVKIGKGDFPKFTAIISCF